MRLSWPKDTRPTKVCYHKTVRLKMKNTKPKYNSSFSVKPLECPVCGQSMAFSGQADYYDRAGPYKTPIHFCKSCDIFYRQVDDARRLDHFHAASYVQRTNEQDLFHTRIKFFRYVLSLVEKYAKAEFRDAHRSLRLVDFGSSYGHLLELAEDNGMCAVGIEINEDLLASCKRKGMVVYKDLKELPEKVDAVTLIDSLYYVPDCRAVLADIRKRLSAGGILIVRVTNRNLYARFMGKYVSRGDFTTIGDAIVGYSVRGMRKLLALTGFRILKIIPDYGKGKRLGVRKKLLYWVGYALTLLAVKRVILTPGIIVVARVGIVT